MVRIMLSLNSFIESLREKILRGAFRRISVKWHSIGCTPSLIEGQKPKLCVAKLSESERAIYEDLAKEEAIRQAVLIKKALEPTASELKQELNELKKSQGGS